LLKRGAKGGGPKLRKKENVFDKAKMQKGLAKVQSLHVMVRFCNVFLAGEAGEQDGI